MITEQNFNGFLAFVFLLAVPMTAILGIVIRRLYRKAITRAMMMDAGAAPAAFDVPAPTHPNGRTLEFDIAPLPRRTRLRVGLAARYFASGLAYSVVLVVAMFLINDIAFLPVRFTVVVGSFAFIGLVLALYVAGLRSYLILLGAVVWISLLYVVAPQSIDVIAILAGPALLLALLVGNPLLRTTTLPLFLVSVAIIVPLTFSLDLVYFGMVTGVLDGLALNLPSGVSLTLYILLGAVIMLAVGIGVAWIVIRMVARATAGSSEFMMQHDVTWLFQTIWLIGLGWGTNGPVVLSYFLAFAAYRVTLVLLRPRGAAAEVNLLLRVFGQRRSQTQLARGLLLDWRLDGPVLLIGAEDLATETLEATELAAFLQRRLERIFIATPQDLDAARAAGETRLGDGLFPMQDYYCRDNSWRPTVLTLMSRARRVLVDMRGFDAANQGIRYEIDALASRVPASRITVLVEKEGLERAKALFTEAWAGAGRSEARDRIMVRLA